MTTLFGIPNCDTVKKARSWLDKHAQAYQFHDVRKDGLDKSTVEQWLSAVGPAVLVNKRSTTWKQLTDNEKSQALEGDSAALLLQHPTLIKRPVLITESAVHVGFNADMYQQIFN